MPHPFCAVTVVGLGYVGLPTAALIARAGHTVQGVDVDPFVIETLRAGRSPIPELQVADVVERALQAGRLKADLVAQPADVFIICVPTPVTADKRADVSIVAKAIAATAPRVKKGDLVILESTSPIGTTRDVIGGALRAVGLDPYVDVDVCYCPERVFPGETIREILQNERVVGGLTRKAAERAGAFYETFCNGAVTLATAQEAEFSKLMENTFRDVNIALANVFARIAERAGVDVREVIQIANRHPRVNVHTPGPGVGGHCIPVDPWFLVDAFPGEAQFLRAARGINDGQAAWLLDRAEKAGLQRGGSIAILGAAYRGDIDDARDTPTEHLVAALADRQYAWTTHDPHVDPSRVHAQHDLKLTKDLSAALSGAAAAFVMTDHSAYRGLQPRDFSGMAGRLIVDGRRMLAADAFVDAGFTVISVGAPG